MVHEATFNSDNYPNGKIIELACGHFLNSYYIACYPIFSSQR